MQAKFMDFSKLKHNANEINLDLLKSLSISGNITVEVL